jgi:hypothetical protein
MAVTPLSVAKSDTPLTCIISPHVAGVNINGAIYGINGAAGTTLGPAVDGQSFQLPISTPGLYDVVVNLDNSPPAGGNVRIIESTPVGGVPTALTSISSGATSGYFKLQVTA